jgi:hypothetical protein
LKLGKFAYHLGLEVGLAEESSAAGECNDVPLPLVGRG